MARRGSDSGSCTGETGILTIKPLKSLIMEKEKVTAHDEELIELAYSTTYRSSIRTMIQEADTERCRIVLRRIMEDADVDWED